MGCGTSAIAAGHNKRYSALMVSDEALKSLPIVALRYHEDKEPSEDYDLAREILGSGISGAVTLAVGKADKRRYAVKGFDKRRGASSRDLLQNMRSECEIFLRMDHPHVARLMDVYETPSHLYFVMEYCAGGEVTTRLKARGRYSEREAAESLYQMLLAVNYLHSHGIVHRDLKLQNFLYASQDSELLKLIDFGVSTFWSGGKAFMDEDCGTLGYMAPEVISGQGYTNKCDLWSIGVIAYFLLSGSPPFSGRLDMMQFSIQQARYDMTTPEKWGQVSDSAKDFVKKLLLRDPRERLSAVEAMEHPWMKSQIRKSAEYDEVIAVPRSTVSSSLLSSRSTESWEPSERDVVVSPSTAASSPIEPAGLGLDVLAGLRSYAAASAFQKSCLLTMAWALTTEEREQVRNLFLEMDINKTGTITKGEFRKVLEETFQVGPAEADQLFASLSSSRPMSLVPSQIRYNDFLASMVHVRISLHEDLVRAAFRRFDPEDTGTITADSLRAFFGEGFEGIEELKEEGISYGELLEFLKLRLSLPFICLRRSLVDDTDEEKEGKKETFTSEVTTAGGGDLSPPTPREEPATFTSPHAAAGGDLSPHSPALREVSFYLSGGSSPGHLLERVTSKVSV